MRTQHGKVVGGFTKLKWNPTKANDSDVEEDDNTSKTKSYK